MRSRWKDAKSDGRNRSGIFVYFMLMSIVSVMMTRMLLQQNKFDSADLMIL